MNGTALSPPPVVQFGLLGCHLQHPPPIPPPLLGNSCPSLWQGGGEEAALCSYLSLRSRECGEELEIALADTDTCAEQQGPALAVVIAYCMAMSQPEPRSGSTRLPCLPHPAGKLMLPLPVLWKWGGGPKAQEQGERMGNESILQLFKLSRCFQVPGRAVRAVICCIISVAIPARGAPVCAEELLAASQNPNAACSERGCAPQLPPATLGPALSTSRGLWDPLSQPRVTKAARHQKAVSAQPELLGKKAPAAELSILLLILLLGLRGCLAAGDCTVRT